LPGWVKGTAKFLWDHVSDLSFDVGVACVFTGGTVCVIAGAGLAVLSTIQDGIQCSKTNSCSSFGLDLGGDAIQVVTGIPAEKLLEEMGVEKAGKAYAEARTRMAGASTLPAQGAKLNDWGVTPMKPSEQLSCAQVFAC
jgi:hypothetical protein